MKMKGGPTAPEVKVDRTEEHSQELIKLLETLSKLDRVTRDKILVTAVRFFEVYIPHND